MDDYREKRLLDFYLGKPDEEYLKIFRAMKDAWNKASKADSLESDDENKTAVSSPVLPDSKLPK